MQHLCDLESLRNHTVNIFLSFTVSRSCNVQNDHYIIAKEKSEMVDQQEPGLSHSGGCGFQPEQCGEPFRSGEKMNGNMYWTSVTSSWMKSDAGNNLMF